MKGDLHVRFWNSGRKSDLPADCTQGVWEIHTQGEGRQEITRQRKG
jgi:hypothetical protein